MLMPLSSTDDSRIEAAPPHCTVCGTPLISRIMGGQCPRCLLSLGSSFGLPGDDAAADDLLGPTQVRGFGDYELLEEIARGGMGVVYRARQRSLGREVAVKMILAGELATSESVQRFRNEASAAAQLDHSNIVSVYEIGQHEMQHFFSMRLVGGRCHIAQWARALDLPPEKRAVAIAAMMAKVARAVAFAHERGVLHRDLKPSNILVDEKDEPQMTDFGLAKLINLPGADLTISAAMLGSPSYMAPEQADSRHRDVTTLTDVYGLGAVLYEMLAGRPPFLGKTPLATARLVVEEMPERLRGIPRDLETLCLKCLAKEPAQRYVSALALADDLERFVRGDPIRARPLTTPEAVWRWTRRRPKIAALVGALLLAFLLGFAGVTWQWRRAEHARSDQAKTLAHLGWDQMTRWARTGEEPRALAYLASLIRERPDNWRAAMYAMSIVDRRSFPALAGPAIHPQLPLVLKTTRLAPDGSWLAAADKDGHVRVWETAAARETAQFHFESSVTALAVSGGPVKLAVATKDGGLTTAAEPNIQPSLVGRPELSSPIVALQFSADGGHLLARSAKHVDVYLTSAIAQPPLGFAMEDGIDDARISADGAHVLAWNGKRACVWDTGTGAELLQIPAMTRFGRVALAGSGKRVAFIDGDHFVRVFEVDSSRQYAPIENPFGNLDWIALNGAGDRVTITSDNNLTIYDIVSGLPVSPTMEHHYQVDGLEATSDGERLVSAGWDGAINLWNAREGSSLLSPIEVGSTQDAEFSPSRDGSKILVHLPQRSDRTESITVWRGTPTREPQRRMLPGLRDFDAGRMSPDGRLGALGMIPGNRSYVYELESGKVLLDHALAGRIFLHLFSPDMRKCYALTVDGRLYGWSLETGEELWPPDQQPGFIHPAEISPDGSRIIAGHDDGHIRVHDTVTGRLVQTLEHPGDIRVLRFAPDGSGRFISAALDGSAHVWDLKSGKKLQTLVGHTHTIISAGWSPDGRYVATASYDKTARVWEAATGRLVGQPMQHLSWLAHLEFSPDGQLLATACRDGNARLWHPLTGEPASPQLQGATCETVRFTADGKALLVRDQEGFSFWDVQNPEPASVHYPEPSGGGVGMDAENYRSIMSADGRRVFLGCSMNYGALWSVPQPRGEAPAWFPEFLEALARLKFDQAGEARSLPFSELEKFLPAIRKSGPNNEYAIWGERVIGSAGR
jgi:serine/threonine protein kinase/WD40 repeat protein